MIVSFPTGHDAHDADDSEAGKASREGAAPSTAAESRNVRRIKQRDCAVLSRIRREAADEMAQIVSSVVRARGGCGPEAWARRLSDPRESNGPSRQAVSRWMEAGGPRVTLGDVSRLPVEDLDRLLLVLGEWNHARRLRAQEDPRSPMEHGLRVGSAVGSLQSTLVEAMADGVIDDDELDAILGTLDRLARKVRAAQRDLNRSRL